MENKDRLLRLTQIIGQAEVTPEQAEINRKQGKGPRRPRPAIDPIIPVSKSSWWKGVQDGRYPKPLKLSGRTTAWRESDIMELLDSGAA
jgi:hypothetical protein